MRLVSLVVVVALVFPLDAYADTPAERYAQVRSLMQRDELIPALQEVDSLRNEFPRDVDYALARAQILSRLGRRQEAIDELQGARQLAPDYEELWRLQYVLLAQEADQEQQRKALQQAASEQFPDAAWWQEDEQAGEWHVLAGAGFDSLSRDLPGWNDQFVELSHQSPSRTRVAARLGRYERYDNTDYVATLSAQRQLPQQWFAGGAAALAGGAVFQAGVDLSVYAGRPIGDAYVGRAGIRHKSFDSVDVTSFSAHVEKYIASYRLAYAATVTQLDGSGGFLGHAFTANWYPRETSSIGITLSAGSEAELLGDGRVLETDVRGVALSGRHELNTRLALQFWIGTHEQGDFYRRKFLGLAVSVGL